LKYGQAPGFIRIANVDQVMWNAPLFVFRWLGRANVHTPVKKA
jgi:hypothetical protein